MLSSQEAASPWISDEASFCGDTDQPVNMQTLSHNPAAAVQLHMVQSSEAESWESSAESSKNQCSEEHVLTCTFDACDLEQTGQVSVFRIIEYLQSVTGQSCEEGRLQMLYKMLDPEERGAAVDLPTFRAIMKTWIENCRQDGGLDSTKEGDKFVDDMRLWPSGRWQRAVSSAAQLEGYGGDIGSVNPEEAAALMSSIEDLEYGHKKLAMQNAKLQRTIEAAEEHSSRLTEEIFQLKSRLRSSQQALEQAKSVSNELEDLKVVAKSLEEENGKLHSQARQLEKEQQCLSLQVNNLQEENRKLLTERDRVKQKVAGLAAEKSDLKTQLCEYETLLSCKDTALTETTNHAEELTAMLAEYKTVVQELRLETSQLQEQLSQTYEDLAMLLKEVPHELKPHCQLPAQPLCVEIEEIQQGGKVEASLPSPLCGVLPASGGPALVQLLVGRSPVAVRAGAEEQAVSMVDCTPAWLAQQSPTGEGEALAEQQQRLMPESTEEPRDWDCPAKEELCEHGGEKQLRIAKGTADEHSSLCCVETHVFPWPEGKAARPLCLDPQPADSPLSSATERSPRGLQEQALVPVQNQLSPVKQKQLPHCWFETTVPQFPPPQQSRPHVLPSRLLLGLLLTLLLLPALCYLGLSCRQQPGWTMPSGLAWPHLQLRYLRPPPQ
nr:protein KASH5 isoform X3 [Pelodiscus sinensis]|eukprot:XP_025039356.1 protein KASH5 isoform X3 [Pelodiscus sinensis]